MRSVSPCAPSADHLENWRPIRMDVLCKKGISSLRWKWKQNSVSTYIQLINSMEQNSYWKPTSCSASHKILHLLWNPKDRTRRCITVYPSSVFCTSSSIWLFSISEILALRERNLEYVITIKILQTAPVQFKHRISTDASKNSLSLDLLTQLT